MPINHYSPTNPPFRTYWQWPVNWYPPRRLPIALCQFQNSSPPLRAYFRTLQVLSPIFSRFSCLCPPKSNSGRHHVARCCLNKRLNPPPSECFTFSLFASTITSKNHTSPRKVMWMSKLRTTRPSRTQTQTLLTDYSNAVFIDVRIYLRVYPNGNLISLLLALRTSFCSWFALFTWSFFREITWFLSELNTNKAHSEVPTFDKFSLCIYFPVKPKVIVPSRRFYILCVLSVTNALSNHSTANHPNFTFCVHRFHSLTPGFHKLRVSWGKRWGLPATRCPHYIFRMFLLFPVCRRTPSSSSRRAIPFQPQVIIFFFAPALFVLFACPVLIISIPLSLLHVRSNHSVSSLIHIQFKVYLSLVRTSLNRFRNI